MSGRGRRRRIERVVLCGFEDVVVVVAREIVKGGREEGSRVDFPGEADDGDGRGIEMASRDACFELEHACPVLSHIPAL